MAVTEQRQLYAPFIESLGEKYGTALGDIAGKPLTDIDPTTGQPLLAPLAPQIAPQTALQQQATTRTTAGLGAYSPYVTAAGAAGTTAGGILGAAGTELTGAGATLGGVSPYISAAGAGLGGAGTAMAGADPYITGAQGAAGLLGPMTGAQMATIDPTTGQTVTPTLAAGSYMSPYQQQVIDTTLSEFDRQRQIQQQQISDAAVAIGGYGGGREGVMQAEYTAQSGRDRAALQAQLQQQGYTQAQAAKQADMMARLGIGGAQQQYATGLAGLAGQQLGLGQATGALAGQQAGMAGQRAGLGQAQLGLGQYELGQAGALQGFQGTDISRAGQVGAMDQAYAQAQIDAQRERDRMMLYEPYERAGFLGQGVMGLLGGMAPQYQFSTQANPSPLATALGIGVTGAGIYKMMGQGAAGFRGS